MSQTSRTLRVTAITLGVASVLAIVGCSKVAPNDPGATPTPSGSSVHIAPDSKALPDGVQPLFQQDLLTVSAASRGKFAEEGRYIVASKPYGSFDTLTKIKFQGGDVGYFVSSGGRAFGNAGSSEAAPADEASAKLSSMSALEPGSSSQKAAQELLEAYRDRLK